MSKAIVIGAGFGGLASAVHLSRKGYDVTILEARNQPGGRAGVIEKQGFVFDMGPTIITAPYLLDNLFLSCNENPKDYFELLPIDPFYQIIFHDGTPFDFSANDEQLIENIRRISPADVDGYLKLAAHAEKIFDVGYTKLANYPFEKFSSMLRVAPDMIRLKNYKSVYALVSSYVKDERLRQAFSFEPLLVGGNPTSITSIYLLIHWLERKWGVHFVKGGTCQLVSALVRLLQKRGVQFEYNASVEAIDVEGGRTKRVWTKDGRSFDCDIIVSNADPVRVYRDFIAKSHRPVHSDKRLKAKTHSMGLFVAYFGSNRTYESIAHHTILLGPRYEGLLKDIFDNKVLADDFSLYLHAPTRTDESMAPKGHESFYVLSPVPNNQSKINWTMEKDRYKDKIYSALENRLLPNLKSSIVVEELVTPDYFEHELQSEHGAAFGIEPSFRQSAYFRFHNRSPDVQGLYFVGANTHPGAGVPGVLKSAEIIDHLVPDLRTRKPAFEQLQAQG